MTRDPLDELLDRSAPYAPEAVSESLTTIYQAMAQDARGTFEGHDGGPTSP